MPPLPLSSPPLACHRFKQWQPRLRLQVSCAGACCYHHILAAFSLVYMTLPSITCAQLLSALIH